MAPLGKCAGHNEDSRSIRKEASGGGGLSGSESREEKLVVTEWWIGRRVGRKLFLVGFGVSDIAMEARLSANFKLGQRGEVVDYPRGRTTVSFVVQTQNGN